jgi:hypothetical protein
MTEIWSNSSALLSTASEDEIFAYTQGLCHVFALALHRTTGWPMMAVLDQDNRWWADEEDEDNFIPSVVHVFCLDGEGNAWDIRGRRPLHTVREEMEGWTRIREYDSDEIFSQAELTYYCGCWGEDGAEAIERPLVELEENEIGEAMEIATRVLAGIPGFPVMDDEPLPEMASL